MSKAHLLDVVLFTLAIWLSDYRCHALTRGARNETGEGLKHQRFALRRQEAKGCKHRIGVIVGDPKRSCDYVQHLNFFMLSPSG